MRIAIVDDHIELARQTEEIVNRFFAQKKQKVTVEVYQDGYPLLSKAEYDLYILDVEMPTIDGVTLAAGLLERSRDTQVVFLTAYERYAYQSLQLGVYKYVLKSDVEEKLPIVLEKTYREYLDRREAYLFKGVRGNKQVRISDIQYLVKDQKYTVFHCVQGETSERASLEEVYQRLPQERFIFVARGQLINVEHVVDLKGNTIEITGGKKFTISRFYYPKAMEVLTKYLGRR